MLSPRSKPETGMIVVVETNAARTVKFAKQMPLVDASAELLSAAVTTFLFRVKELVGAWLSNASQWMRSNGDNDDGDRGFMGLQKN